MFTSFFVGLSQQVSSHFLSGVRGQTLVLRITNPPRETQEQVQWMSQELKFSAASVGSEDNSHGLCEVT